MTVSSEFIEFLLETLAPLGPVQSRRMFGGAGLYCDGVMFALIADDAVYLKANDQTSQVYTDEGLKPFTYQGKAKPVTMSYWRIPERLFDDGEEFVVWAGIALGVAKSAAKPKRKSAQKNMNNAKVTAKTKAKPKVKRKSKTAARTKRKTKTKR